MHSADSTWLNRADPSGHRVLIDTPTFTILPGVTAIQTGGHFAGSMVLHWTTHLFIADSIVNVPSGLYPDHSSRPTGTSTYAFMWSIPNMIPLDPDRILAIWRAVRGFEFSATHGLFIGWEVRGEGTKGRVLESMKIQVRAQGFESHALLEERVEG